MAIDRLAPAEAHPDVALEAYVVARWELERVEAGQQTVGFRLVLPVAEDARFCGAPIFVRDDIFVLNAVLHGLGDAASCKTAVDCCKGNVDFFVRTRLEMLAYKILGQWVYINYFRRWKC